MKPTIIYINEQAVDNRKIVMLKEDFEKYINEAYEQGKRDGATALPNTTTPATTPNPSWYTVTADTTAIPVNRVRGL